MKHNVQLNVLHRVIFQPLSIYSIVKLPIIVTGLSHRLITFTSPFLHMGVFCHDWSESLILLIVQNEG